MNREGNVDFTVNEENRQAAAANTEEQVIKIKGNEALLIKLFQECIESENTPKEIWAIYDGYVFRTRLVRPD